MEVLKEKHGKPCNEMDESTFNLLVNLARAFEQV